MENNAWYSVRDQSLAIYARNAGFDLAVYHKYSEPVQEELRKRAIKAALYEIESDFDDQGLDIGGINKGVYVIALSNPLSVKYKFGRSQVIYIGMGNIVRRLKAHFGWTLFDFMLDLAGANFDFHIACPTLPRRPMYYKHVEHLMLEYFNEQYGGIDDARRYPILNKNSGINQNVQGGTDWWKKPLKATGKKPLWELRPTDYSVYAPLDAGE